MRSCICKSYLYFVTFIKNTDKHDRFAAHLLFCVVALTHPSVFIVFSDAGTCVLRVIGASEISRWWWNWSVPFVAHSNGIVCISWYFPHYNNAKFFVWASNTETWFQRRLKNDLQGKCFMPSVLSGDAFPNAVDKYRVGSDRSRGEGINVVRISAALVYKRTKPMMLSFSGRATLRTISGWSPPSLRPRLPEAITGRDPKCGGGLPGHSSPLPRVALYRRGWSGERVPPVLF